MGEEGTADDKLEGLLAAVKVAVDAFKGQSPVETNSD